MHELNGIPCLDLDTYPQAKKEIACTRSFGGHVTELEELSQAVTHFASRAAQKLRSQQSHACSVLVFIRTSPFRKNDPQYSRSAVIPLRLPSSNTFSIASAALSGLKSIYRFGYTYAKAGVILLDLHPATVQQRELLFGDEAQANETRHTLQDRFGKDAMSLASALPSIGTRGQLTWQMKQERRSPAYTTDWNGLVTAS